MKLKSRILRIFLVAALVTGIVGSLVPVSRASAALMMTAVTPTLYKANSAAKVTFVLTTGDDEVRIGTQIMLKYPAGFQVPSSVPGNSITVNGVSVSAAATGSAGTITFFSPVAVPGSTTTVIVGTTAGVKSPKMPSEVPPGGFAATIAGITEDDSTATRTEAFVRFSSGAVRNAAARGVTVGLTGEGFAKNTGATIAIGLDPTTISTSGTIDSNGTLTASFVAGSMTFANSGTFIVVTDGAGNTTGVTDFFPDGPRFTQSASATISARVSPGGTAVVTLTDWRNTERVTATIAGVDIDPIGMTNVIGAGSGTPSLRPALFTVPADTTTGVKQVKLTGAPTGVTITLTIDIVSRSLTVNPTSLAPGQAFTISGSGFSKGGVIPAGTGIMVSGVAVNPAAAVTINADGTFLFAGFAPTEDRFSLAPGTKRFEVTDGTLTGTSSGVSLQSRSATFSPTSGPPGSAVLVTGSGFTVGTGSIVVLTGTGGLAACAIATAGFPVASDGTFTGSFTVPLGCPTGPITIRATDNAATLVPPLAGTSKTATVVFTVPTGAVVIVPIAGSTGNIATVTGTNFPTSTNLSVLRFGRVSALPIPSPATDAVGSFTVNVTVPAAVTGGSLTPGAVVVTVTVGGVTGTTSFTLSNPSITIGPSGTTTSGSSITITGVGFSALSTVTVITIGSAAALPAPAPRTDGIGGFTATILVPALNPGTYTVTVTAGVGFTANGTLTISTGLGVFGQPVDAATALASLLGAGIMELASNIRGGGNVASGFATDPGDRTQALAGNPLTQILPNSVLILTLTQDATVTVSGVSFSVTGGVPAFIPVGKNVTIAIN